MQISKNAAKQIVNEIAKLVHQNINLMDETGHIIASCDINRIGKFHEGAYKIITEQLTEYYISEDMETETVRKGLNLPLELDGKIVGVVGITGDYDEVINSGKLIKKMTEILINEKRNTDKQLINKRVRNSFLEQWVILNEFSDEKDLEEKGKKLGIDIYKPRRIVMLSISDLDNYKDSTKGQSKIADIENSLSAFLDERIGNIFFRNLSRQIILLNSRSTKDVVKYCRQLSEYIYKRHKLTLTIGIDAVGHNIHQSYLQAQKAWKSAEDNGTEIVAYEDLDLEIIINELSKDRKIEYIKKIFHQMEPSEIREYLSMLQLYYKYDGSLADVSDAMFIHKNTLQYRISKLKKETGYDVRNIKESAALYMALMIAKDLEMQLDR